MAYIRAIGSGDFHNPSVWFGGVVPSTGDVACPETSVITIQSDVLAVLSVTTDDSLAAGGAGGIGRTGRFKVNSGAVVNILGGLRYDLNANFSRVGTSAPLVLTEGTVNLGAVVCVDSPVTSYAVWAVMCAIPTGATLTVNIASVVFPSKCGNTDTGTVYFAPASSTCLWNMTLGSCKLVNISAASIARAAVVGTSTTTAEFNLVLNGAIPQGYTSSTVQIDHGETLTPNQTITVNADSFGGGVPLYGYGSLYVANAHTVTFTSPHFSFIDSFSSSSQPLSYALYISKLRGSLSFLGDVTIYREYAIQSRNSGTVSISGTLYLNASTINRIIDFTSLTGAVTLGDVVSNSQFSGLATSHQVYIGSSQLTVGNVSYASTTTAQAGVFNIDQSTSNSVSFGSIDARNYRIKTNVKAYLPVQMLGRSAGVTVDGNVYGSNTNDLSDDVARSTGTLYIGGSLTPATINGDAIGGSASPAVAFSTSALGSSLDIYGSAVSSAGATGNVRPPPALSVENQNDVVVDHLVCGSDGRFPIDGRFRFRNAATATFSAIDVNGVVFSVGVGAGTAIVPLSSDVREGVAVGSTAGTLVVPQAANVLTGVVYDNGTTGTLTTDAGSATDYTTRFDTLDTTTAAIKAKTDQLDFTANGVITDSGSVGDYTSDLQQIKNLVVAGLK